MKNLSLLSREFLEYCEVERNKSPRTITNYQHYLKRFLAWGEKNNVKNPADITQEKVKKYRLYLNRLDSNNLKKKTQNYHIIALRAFLKYLIKNDIRTLAPEKIELAKNEDREINFLVEDELDRLLKATDGNDITSLRDKAILETLFSTGLRVSELINLNRDKINLQSNEFAVKGKGRKTRVVFLSSDAKTAIKNYLAERIDGDKALFVGHHLIKNSNDNPPAGGQITSSKLKSASWRRNSKQIENSNFQNKANSKSLIANSGHSQRLTARSIQRIIKKYAVKAGITKNVTPHVMRHTFGTDLLRSGADLRAVQELLGHSSITTTQIYTHITDQHLREVHQAFHGRRKK